MLKRLSKCIGEYKKNTILTPIFVSMEVVKYLMVKLPVICMPIESAYQTTHGNICQISYMINQEMEDSQVLMNCKL